MQNSERGKKIGNVMVSTSRNVVQTGKAVGKKLILNQLGSKNMKLQQGKFSLDVKKSFFTERVVGSCSRLPREVVIAASLVEFKCLDNILGHTWFNFFGLTFLI